MLTRTLNPSSSSGALELSLKLGYLIQHPSPTSFSSTTNNFKFHFSLLSNLGIHSDLESPRPIQFYVQTKNKLDIKFPAIYNAWFLQLLQILDQGVGAYIRK